jgi:hypothetical protein
MFYHIYLDYFDGEDPQRALFVEIIDRPIIGKSEDTTFCEGSLKIIDSIREDTRNLGFKTLGLSPGSTVLHVDSVAYKIKVVPHYLPELAATQMCCLRMWAAR